MDNGVFRNPKASSKNSPVSLLCSTSFGISHGTPTLGRVFWTHVSVKDYAEGGKISYMTLKVTTFIGRLIRHIPDKHFPMIRYAGLFSNRWKERPNCDQPLVLVGAFFGNREQLQSLFAEAGKDSSIPAALLRPG